jgi:dihydrofolate reductase
MLGAIVTGWRDFDVSQAWGGNAPLGVPIFIVTHTVPQEWAGKDSPFTFVTDGVQSALQKARQMAGDKNVSVGGTKIVQQCLNAGLLDEIQIDLVPILLGEGIRLFDHLGSEPIELESTGVTEGAGVTHLRFRVIK